MYRQAVLVHKRDAGLGLGNIDQEGFGALEEWVEALDEDPVSLRVDIKRSSCMVGFELKGFGVV